MKVTGRCHCGKITYEADVDPEKSTICHCTDCQMLTGSAYRANVQAPSGSFRLLTGTPTTYLKTAESGNKRLHAFCGDCGTPVYAANPVPDPPSYSLRIGCLDRRAELAPKKQIWCQSSVGWSDDLGPIPKVMRQ